MASLGKRVMKLKNDASKASKKLESLRDELDATIAELVESTGDDFSAIMCCYEACLAELSQFEAELDCVTDDLQSDGSNDNDDEEWAETE